MMGDTDNQCLPKPWPTAENMQRLQLELNQAREDQERQICSNFQNLWVSHLNSSWRLTPPSDNEDRASGSQMPPTTNEVRQDEEHGPTPPTDDDNNSSSSTTNNNNNTANNNSSSTNSNASAEEIDDDSEPMDMVNPKDYNVPKLDARGRIKQTKCRVCGHRSDTKGEWWQHMREHYPSHKLLECRLCPFTTTLKHHWEYHLRWHSGEKPFKCPEEGCAYACANRSMLNSHMKSHSNIYQYHCADCGYCAKHCHTFKQHLRKLRHRPGLLLNPDGTPNTTSVIDVYGSRRGPRRGSRVHSAAAAPPPPPPPEEPPQPQPQLPLPNAVSLLQIMMMEASGRMPFPNPFLGPLAFANPLLLAAMQQQAALGLPLPEPATSPSEAADETAEALGALDLSTSSPRADEATAPAQSMQESSEEEQACSGFPCPFCGTSFMHLMLFKLHMEFHNLDGDPFDCKKCGARCGNQIDFNIHMTRVSHK